MRILLTLVLILATAPSVAQERYVDWQLGYSPPGGDIIAGNRIGRYVVEITPTVEWEYVKLSARWQAYGVQKWVPKEVRGHGLEKFKGSYAWGVDDWRFTVTPRLEVGTERVSFFIENYAPIDRNGIWDQGGAHGQETEYYWLLGVKGRFTF